MMDAWFRNAVQWHLREEHPLSGLRKDIVQPDDDEDLADMHDSLLHAASEDDFHDELPFAEPDEPEPGEHVVEDDTLWPDYAEYRYFGPVYL